MCSTRRRNLTFIAAAFVFGTLSGNVAIAQPISVALKTTAEHLPEPVEGIVTVTLASGAWIKLRTVDLDNDRRAACTDRIIIKAATATMMTTSAGRRYVNFTFGPTFVATAWVEDVDWDCAVKLARQLEQENKITDAIALLSPFQERPEIKAEYTRLLAKYPNVGQSFGPSFQFDTKGVDFVSWMRGFRAQLYGNWLIPYAAMTLHGHTVLRFTIHRDGAISDLVVVQPSGVDAFTKAAVNAIKASDPTVPLPSQYPDERMVMTIIFYYNENPGGGGLH
jgi:TonB family protein